MEPVERVVRHFQDELEQLKTRLLEMGGIAEEQVRTAVKGLVDRDHGLIDQVGYLEEAITAAKTAAGLTEARIVTYHRPRQYRATIYSSPPTPAPVTGLPDLARVVFSGPRFLYLWWP